MKTLLCTVCSAMISFASLASIDYTLTGPVLGEYTYSYTVNNALGSPLTDFIVYFPAVSTPDSGYTLVSATVPDASWSSLLVPWSAVDLGAYYEASTGGAGIAPGASMTGFSVTFSYAGPGVLGSQEYEVYDSSFSLLDSGVTTLAAPSGVPEQSGTIVYGLLSFLGITGFARWSQRNACAPTA